MTKEEFFAATQARVIDLVTANPGCANDWPDSAKLRLVACHYDSMDLKKGVYDRTGLQDDIRRMADRIEVLEDAGDWPLPESRCECGRKMPCDR